MESLVSMLDTVETYDKENINIQMCGVEIRIWNLT